LKPIPRAWILTLTIFLLASHLLACQPALTPPAAVTLPQAGIPPVKILGQRQYAVHQRLSIINKGPGEPQKQTLWVALIHDFAPYQSVQSMQVSPKAYTPVTDEYGNQYAEFDFSHQAAGTTQTVTIDYKVTVYEVGYDLSACQGSLPDAFNQPELHIESANPQIVALARQLSQGKSTPCQQVRAFYDYIGDTLVYTFNGASWGAQAALGPMGADCTEYSDLLAALSRANGIPARYFEGLLYLDSFTRPLAATEHAWADVYLPSAGWAAMDPTLGRTLVNRDKSFAHYTPDHIILTLGANPSVLRGSSYWTNLYWPGNSTQIQVSGDWQIERLDGGGTN
jgi:transglutaminase-like putative cysteine protease